MPQYNPRTDWPNLTLMDLLGYRQEDAELLKQQKAAEPNHRRNRVKNKLARKARKRNRQNG
jgi:hypothetical protein